MRFILLFVFIIKVNSNAYGQPTPQIMDDGFVINEYVNDSIIQQTIFYKNGQKRCTILLKNGKKDIPQTFLYDANNIRRGFESYSNGYRQLCNLWNPDSTVFNSYSYKEDTLLGTETYYINGLAVTSIYFKKNTPNGEFFEFYPNGNFKIHSALRGKFIDGKYITYYPNNTIRTFFIFKMGRLIEAKEIRLPNGELIDEKDYFKKIDTNKVYTYLEFESDKYIKSNVYKLMKYNNVNLMHGEYNIKYKDSDIVESVVNYNNGVREGIYRKYYPSGKIAIKGQFLYGLPLGSWEYYNENCELEFYIDY